MDDIFGSLAAATVTWSTPPRWQRRSNASPAVEASRSHGGWRFVEPATESFGESWLRLRLLDAGFPRPVAQIVVADLGYRLDLGWP